MGKGKEKMAEYYENTGILTCRLSWNSDEKKWFTILLTKVSVCYINMPKSTLK